MDDTDLPTAADRAPFGLGDFAETGTQPSPHTQRAPGGEDGALAAQQLASPANDRVRTVPYGALAEERARRKGLQRELQDSLQLRQRLQGRLDMLHELANRQTAWPQPPAQEPAEPKLMDSRDEGSAPDRPVAAMLQQEQAAEADSAFRTQVMQSVRSCTAERPDFMAAYQHAREARVTELSALGYTQEEALAITFDNELEVIRNAFATGRNPAQVIYDYALRQGYRSADPAEPAQGSRPQAPIARPVGRGGFPSEAEKIVIAARGQAASKSLSSTGGGSTGALTLEALAGMSDEEFVEATKGDRWQRLLRG